VRHRRHGAAQLVRPLYRTTLFLLTVLVPAAILQPRIAVASLGDLDLSFSRDGKVTYGIGSGNDSGNGVLVQPDGKIVVSGSSFDGAKEDFALTRINNDGTLDKTFSGDGKQTTSFGSGDDLGSRVVRQTDGKLLVAGTAFNGTDDDFAMARYYSDGSLDLSFSSDGRQTADFGSGNDSASDVLVQADGKIVVAGTAFNGTDDDFGVARFNPDGTPDLTFSNDGLATADVGPDGDTEGLGIAIGLDGKMVIAGHTHWYHSWAFARFNTDGTLDPGLNRGEGVEGIGWSNSIDAAAYAVTIQPDNKILIGGQVDQTGLSTFGLARFNSDGSFDSSFVDGGHTVASFGQQLSGARGMVLQTDGSIVLVGFASNGTDDDFAVARFTSLGFYDEGFSYPDGKLTTPIGSGDDQALGVALQSDGKIVAAGSSSNGSNIDFALTRYIGSPVAIGAGACLWLLRVKNTAGAPDFDPFMYGLRHDQPVAGDWDGDGVTTAGVVRADPATGYWQWFLRNNNSAGNPDVPAFEFGSARTDVPLVGDWDGDGVTTIGVARAESSTGYRRWILRNSNSAGNPDVPSFAYGLLSDAPVVGDWDGDGVTTIGVARADSSTGYWRWILRNSNSAGSPAVPLFEYGSSRTDTPLAGDWDAHGSTTVGLCRRT